MTDKIDVSKCPVSGKCAEFETCEIKQILKQLQQANKRIEEWENIGKKLAGKTICFYDKPVEFKDFRELRLEKVEQKLKQIEEIVDKMKSTGYYLPPEVKKIYWIIKDGE